MTDRNPAPPPSSSRRGRVFLALSVLAGAAALILGLRLRGSESLIADGPAMEPTLYAGERFLIEHTTDVAPGDVVVIHSPADGFDIVKRVIAVGGDTIAIRADAVYRNGAPIALPDAAECRPFPDDYDGERERRCTTEAIGGRRWTTQCSVSSMPEDFPEQTVPAGTIFVLGDHRDRSNDSRNPRIGMVPVEHVRGRMI